MVRNYFYLIVGLLCVLFAVTHTLNGISTTLPTLNIIGIESNAKIAFVYVWHIIGAENLIFGIFLIIMAFQKNMSMVKLVAWLIIAILAMRWIVITYFTMFANSGNIKQLITDTVAIFIVISLLFVGTKAKDRKINE